MIRGTTLRRPLLTASIALVFAGAIGCADTPPSDNSSVSVTSQNLEVARGPRPPFAEYMRERERQRAPRPAPAPKTAEAAQKLAEFQRQLGQRQAAWAHLSPNEREQSRAELKRAIIVGAASTRGGK